MISDLIKAAMLTHIRAGVRILPDGQLHPEEANKIAAIFGLSADRVRLEGDKLIISWRAGDFDGPDL